jgi:hypothetical protein
MVDHFGVLVECSVIPRSQIFDNVDVGELYGSPVSWGCFDEVVSHVANEDPVYVYAFDADEVAWLDLDGIQAQLASLDIRMFATGLMEWAHIPHASMTMGSVSINDSPCEIFEGLESTLRNAYNSLAAVMDGQSGGVSAEHLSKMVCLTHEPVTSQLLRHNANLSLSRNATIDDPALCYCKIKSNFFTNTLFATAKAKSTRGNIC